MAQPQQDRAGRMRTILTMYAIMLLGWVVYQHFFAPKPVQAPQEAAALLTQTWGKERRVREILLERSRKRLADTRANPAAGGPEEVARLEEAVRNQDLAIRTYDRLYTAPAQKETVELSEADMKKRLEEAGHQYEEFYQRNKDSREQKLLNDARQARFQEINVFDFLAVRVDEKGWHWYDQAQQRLKDLENDFLGKTGSVAIEADGKFIPPGEPGDLGKLAEARLNQVREARDIRKQGNLTYKILAVLVGLFGGKNNPYSYFLALLLIVVVLKGATWPLQKKQYQYQRDMMRIQPLVKEVQEKMKGRPPEEQQKRIMQLYKENNVSLAGGCLPMLALAFVLLPVYWMVQDYEHQFIYGKFLWIGSQLSETVWWLADNLAQFDVPLFVIYLVSTVVYSLMQPKPADPAQAQQQKMMLIMMPLMFGFMMWMYKWSSAFMLYWLVLNLVSMYQSWILNRMFGLYNKPAAATASASGGTDAPSPPPTTPLEPMKGVQQKSNGRNGRRSGTPGRIKPRGSGR